MDALEFRCPVDGAKGGGLASKLRKASERVNSDFSYVSAAAAAAPALIEQLPPIPLIRP